MRMAGGRREPLRACWRAKGSRASSQARSSARGRPPNRWPSGLGLPIETIDLWAEADRGTIRYRSTETLRAEGGEAWSRFLADPIGYLGGDPASFRDGVLAALGATVATNSATARVAVFTHGLPINIVLSHALGLDSITQFLVGYGSVTRLRHFGDGRYGVASVNETGHHRWTY